VRRRFGRRRTEFGRMTSSDSTPTALSSPSTTPNQVTARPRTTVSDSTTSPSGVGRILIRAVLRVRLCGGASRFTGEACGRAAPIPERTRVPTNGTSGAGDLVEDDRHYGLPDHRPDLQHFSGSAARRTRSQSDILSGSGERTSADLGRCCSCSASVTMSVARAAASDRTHSLPEVRRLGSPHHRSLESDGDLHR
jgi:hypothetical protein